MAAFPFSPAAADDRFYVNTSGDALVTCGDIGLGYSLGGVCFEPGHIPPDPNGQAIVGIQDDFFGLASGLVCQDLNADTICGDQNIGELHQEFCIETVIGVWSPGGWQEWAELRVFVHGAIFGNPATSPCGPTFSFGTTGRVYHSPGGIGNPPPPIIPPVEVPTVRIDAPGDTIVPVSVPGTGTVVLGCTGTVRVTVAGASVPLVGVSLSPTGCASSPCSVYTSAGLTCQTNPLACCTTLFAVEPSGSSSILCVRESAVRIDVNNDGFWDVVVPAATVTNPPCP